MMHFTIACRRLDMDGEQLRGLTEIYSMEARPGWESWELGKFIGGHDQRIKWWWNGGENKWVLFEET